MDESYFEEDIKLLFSRSHPNPHKYLGLHDYDDINNIIRVFFPHESKIPYVRVGEKIFFPKQSKKNGLFFFLVPKWISFSDYIIFFDEFLSTFDPYSFPTNWKDQDSILFSRGEYYYSYNKLGAHILNFYGILGTNFTLWAPNAISVSVIGDFNNWSPLYHQLRCVSNLGIWEIFLPKNLLGYSYKWSILCSNGEHIIKADPYGFQFESPSEASAKVVSFNSFVWKDSYWKEKQRKFNSYRELPLNIYEVHLGSWKKNSSREDKEFLNYKELAHDLVKYCKKKKYTHVEILPITEHPLFESWGYQVSGFYAPTLRYGTLQDFQYFVNYMHLNDLGVILDWVPGHFPLNKEFLAYFDGNFLYEDMEQGIHPCWKTLYFNYNNNGVINFLIGSALFWCKEMHIDGLRIDAVDSMINLDFGKKENQWLPNYFGGKENLSAIKFLIKLNEILHKEIPGVITIAEDSSDIYFITKPIEEGGLGFDYKWNMGWVHDSLKYFEKTASERSSYYSLITSSLDYSLKERFILSLSHDECSNDKESLFSRMPGNKLNKIDNLKVFLTYFFCFPGKKTLFMGNDLLEEQPWFIHRGLLWSKLEEIEGKQFDIFVRSLNNLYINEKSLWKDDDSNCFFWLVSNENKKNIIVFKRHFLSSRYYLICIHNFSNFCFYNYQIKLDFPISKCREIFNSDSLIFGGSGQISFNFFTKSENHCLLSINIFKLSSIIYKIEY